MKNTPRAIEYSGSRNYVRRVQQGCSCNDTNFCFIPIYLNQKYISIITNAQIVWFCITNATVDITSTYILRNQTIAYSRIFSRAQHCWAYLVHRRSYYNYNQSYIEITFSSEHLNISNLLALYLYLIKIAMSKFHFNNCCIAVPSWELQMNSSRSAFVSLRAVKFLKLAIISRSYPPDLNNVHYLSSPSPPCTE